MCFKSYLLQKLLPPQKKTFAPPQKTKQKQKKNTNKLWQNDDSFTTSIVIS